MYGLDAAPKRQAITRRSFLAASVAAVVTNAGFRQVSSQRPLIGIDGVTEMDWVVNVRKKTPREAARSWMKANEGAVRNWLGE